MIVVSEDNARSGVLDSMKHASKIVLEQLRDYVDKEMDKAYDNDGNCGAYIALRDVRDEIKRRIEIVNELK